MSVNPFSAASSSAPSYSAIGNYNSSDSDDDEAHRSTQKKHNKGLYAKPSISAMNLKINSTSRRLSCATFLLALAYLVMFVSTISLHYTLTNSQADEHNDVSHLNNQIHDISTLLSKTIKEISRFNRTVTNGELVDEVKSLKEKIDAQNVMVQDELDAAKSEVAKELASTKSDIASTISVAQSEIKSEVTSVRTKVDEYKSATQDQFNLENNFMLYQLAGTFTLIGGLISLWHVTSHLRNFHNPVVQRKILAILWMAPIYSTSSWFSLVFPSLEAYLSILKDCYEAYVVYVFLSFLISVMGGGDREIVVDKLERVASHLTQPWGYGCCFRNAGRSERAKADAVLMQCQVYALQFVLFKPLLAVANFCLNHLKLWGDFKGVQMDYKNPQLYLLVLTNLSVSVAFFGLVKFYHAVQDDLSWCRPWPKFLCIKGVVFMTFWQGLALSLLAKTSEGSAGDLSAEGWGKQAQSFLICIEMLIASIAHFYVFPHYEWSPGYIRQQSSKTKFGDSLALRDFFGDLKIIMGGSRAGSKKDDSYTPVDETSPDLETGRALARIRESLSLLEDDQKSQLEEYANRRGMQKGDETTSRVKEPIKEEEKEIKEPNKHRKGTVRSKNFRPKNSRLHR